MENLKHSDVTGDIIKAFYKVYNTLGYGFLERVYENALILELEQMNLNVLRQAPIKVFYNEKEVGDYFADLIVNDCVIVELKAVETITKTHEAQLLNYLKATKIEVGLLLNFGAKAEYKRKVFENAHKNSQIFYQNLNIINKPKKSVSIRSIRVHPRPILLFPLHQTPKLMINFSNLERR